MRASVVRSHGAIELYYDANYKIMHEEIGLGTAILELYICCESIKHFYAILCAM